MGEPDYSVEDLRDEWTETGFDRDRDAIAVEDDGGAMIGYAHFRGGDLLAVVDPQREGEGAAPRCCSGPSNGPESAGTRSCRQGVGDQGASARALLQAHGYEVVRSYYRLERDRAPRDEEPAGLRPLTREDAPASTPSTRPPSARARDYTHRTEEALDAARVRRATPRRSISARVAEGTASRSPAAGRTTSPTSKLLAVHPEHAGQGLGGALLRGGVRRGRAQAASTACSSTSPPTTPTRCALYERVGMTQAWRIDDYHEAAAKLGRR